MKGTRFVGPGSRVCVCVRGGDARCMWCHLVWFAGDFGEKAVPSAGVRAPRSGHETVPC